VLPLLLLMQPWTCFSFHVWKVCRSQYSLLVYFPVNINSLYHMTSLILTVVWWFITPLGIGIKMELIHMCDHFN
jgi:hypothetical protein